MRTHFGNRHREHIIIIREEGCLPRCPSCGFFGASMLERRHITSQLCKINTEKRQRYFKNVELMRARETTFEVGGETIQRVEDFKYLGRILDEVDDDTKAMRQQVRKAAIVWRRVFKVLST